MSMGSAGNIAQDGGVNTYPSSRYAWFVAISLQVAYAIALVDRQILALLVQPIKAHLNLTDTEFSLLAGLAFVLCYSSLGLVFGLVADRHNRRNTIIAGIIFWSLATVACGLTHNFRELFIARMLVGVGEAALNPAAYSMIADYFPKETRARAVSVYTMGSFTGSGAGLIASSAVLRATSAVDAVHMPLLGDLQTWQAAFVIVGLPGFCVAALLTLVREPTRKETSGVSNNSADLRRFLGRKAGVIALIIITFALNGVIYYGVGTWTPALFIRKFHWVASTIGMSLGLIQLIFGTAGILLGGWWVSRPKVADSHTIVFSTTRNALLLIPACVLLAGLSPYASLSIAAMSAVVFLSAIVTGQSAVALFQVTPNMFRGRIIAAYILTGTLLGLGVGATLIAGITDHVFHNDTAVGASLAIVGTGAALLGAFSIHRAMRSKELNLEW